MFGNVGSRLSPGVLALRRAQRFPRVARPSIDPKTLDDYEENFWTPILKFGAGTVGITYAAGGQVGKYTKIGRLVKVTGVITLTSKGSSTGAAVIEGLPFAAGDSQNCYDAVTIGFAGDFASVVGAVIGLVQPTVPRILLYHTNAGAAAGLNNTHLTNTTAIYFKANYTTLS